MSWPYHERMITGYRRLGWDEPVPVMAWWCPLDLSLGLHFPGKPSSRVVNRFNKTPRTLHFDGEINIDRYEIYVKNDGPIKLPLNKYYSTPSPIP